MRRLRSWERYQEPTEEEWEEWDDIAGLLPAYAMEIPSQPWKLERPSTPTNDMQALMEAAPGEEPNWPHGNPALEILERIVDEHLTEEERAVIEVIVYAGHSIRTAADILPWPKSTVHRLYQSALLIIRREMYNHGIESTLAHLRTPPDVSEGDGQVQEEPEDVS